jgi:hypothetical protein
MKTLPAAVLASLALASPALADRDGKGSVACSNCHSGGTVPTVSVVPSVNTVLAGQALSLVVSISTTPTQGSGGFNLHASGGTLSPGDGTVRMVGTEVTHKAPKLGANGAVTFAANWTAPLTPGTYLFTALGNAVNGDDTKLGDQHGSGTATVVVMGGGAGGADAGTEAEGMDAGSSLAPDAGAGAGGGTGGGAGNGGTAGVNTGTAPPPASEPPSGGCTSTGGATLGLYALAGALGHLLRRARRSPGGR